ncbi:MAG: hypothetical protein MJD61_18955 [Proteobacteria bacterium]|nr:hypothetical protein [Pseudomonadota bacterium]
MTDSPKQDRDVVLVHGVTPDGKGLRVLRSRNNTLEAGQVRPLNQGKAISGEVISLRPRQEFPLLCDVKVEVPAASREPAQQPGRPAELAAEPRPARDRRAVRNRELEGRMPDRGRLAERSRSGPAMVTSGLYRQNWDAVWGRSSKKRSLPN